MSIRARAPALQDFVQAIFRANASAPDEARQIAEHLVGANLAGHDSHGVGLVPTYLAHLQSGRVHPNRAIRQVGGIGPFAVFDGQMGYGQPAANAATARAATIAQESGIAVVSLRNVQHIGRVGAYAEQLAAHGLVSLHFVNAVYDQPCVAPFGGSDARLMTNPICIAVPGEVPVVLDFATSGIAMGKVRVAYNSGANVPPGRLIDHKGQPTVSPAVLFEPPLGALLPFGEHKGWGLALVCELLGGALTGGALSSDAAQGGRGLVNGMLSIAIDPERMGDPRALERTVAQVKAHVQASTPADPARPVLLPGEPERIARVRRGREGIPIDDTTWKQIVDGAQASGVAVDAFGVLIEAGAR